MNQPQMKVPFALIPQELVRDRTVSDAAFRTYAIICSWTPNKKDGLRYIHRSDLAEALAIKEPQIGRLTAQLCGAGWLLKSGDGGRNRPARYQPLQRKTMPSEDRVSDENPILRGSGQSVDTLSLYKPSVDEVDSDTRARANAPAADASTFSDKYRFPLPHDFRPPQSWIDAARLERSAAGQPPLSPLQIDALITKFVGAKTQRGKPMDQARWQLAFIEWFVRENHKPQKTLSRKESVMTPTATPLQTAVEPQPAAEMPTATPTPPPPSNGAENADTALAASDTHKTLLEVVKVMGRKMAMPLDQGYQPRLSGASVPPSPPASKIWMPIKRAKFAAFAAAAGIPLPKNCAL